MKVASGLTTLAEVFKVAPPSETRLKFPRKSKPLKGSP